MNKKIYLEHVQKTEQDTLKFRLLALLAAAFGLYLGKSYMPLWPAVTLVVLYSIYTLALGRLIIPRFPTPNFVYGMIIVDAVALTIGFYIVGSVENALVVILLPILVVYYAMYFGYATSLFAATIMSLSYVGVAFSIGQAADVGPTIAVQVPLFYMIAIFGGYLARKRIQEQKEKEELQEFIRVEMQAKGLLDVAKNLGETLELKKILYDVVEQMTGVSGLGQCIVALMDDEGNKLVGRSGNVDLARLRLKNFEELVFSPKDDLATSSAIEKGKPVFTMAESNGGMPSWALELGARRLLVLPISIKGRSSGAIFLFDGETGSLDEDKIGLAQAYCDLAANAIGNALVYKGMEDRVRQVVGALEGTVQRMERLREPAKRVELQVGDLRIEGARARAFMGDSLVNLSPTEFEVLYILAENAGRPLNEATLLRRVWGEGYSGQGNVVDVCVHRLRRKLEKAGSRSRILTIRGMGYMLSSGVVGVG
ncbi:MAG: winged helix-turn-helix domain-containing protein [Chloroflexi bacterium]|nr:winged helix-turn-helix domain-containing protein [Chloroflexota bacterium]